MAPPEPELALPRVAPRGPELAALPGRVVLREQAAPRESALGRAPEPGRELGRVAAEPGAVAAEGPGPAPGPGRAPGPGLESEAAVAGAESGAEEAEPTPEPQGSR